jgi:lysophospholipase L1-like esterase
MKMKLLSTMIKQKLFFLLCITGCLGCVSLGFLMQSHFRIFLIGDSTMADKSLIDNPEHGWGQSLPVFFSENVQVLNYARNGRSTKSFSAEGRWNVVINQLQEGDYVFIEFGHNDAKKEDTSRFASPIPEYRDNLLKFIREAREKKAIPILLTPIARRDFKDGKLAATHGDYPRVMKEVAGQEHVPLIDMFEKSKQLILKLGDEGSKALYLAGVHRQEFPAWHGKMDNTHFTRSGAYQMASLVVEGIKELQLPLSLQLVEQSTEMFPGAGKRVGLDYFFNSEWRVGKDSVKERFHYVWEDTMNSGYSILGRSIDLLGADLDTLQSAPTDTSLKKFSVYMLVDPDTPVETKNPNYISEQDAVVIERWVNNGGVLALFANDKGNCEFEHLNKLAERFGIHFNEDSYHRVVGKAYDMGKSDDFPPHPIFKDVKQIFLKEICSLTLQNPAEPVFIEQGHVFMASAHVGLGFVFAVGDPWFYNEYMDTRILPAAFENKKAAVSLFRWLLGQEKKLRQSSSAIK